MDRVDQLVHNIQSLTIQGATAVAQAVLEELLVTLKQTSHDTNTHEQLLNVGKRLAYARPTEPLAQNALRFIFTSRTTRDEYRKRIKEYQRLITDAEQYIVDVGSRLLINGGKYLTHCHSSTVVSIFKNALQNGQRCSIIATETRPRYQGRTTAQELFDAGFDDVTMIIDGVAVPVLEGAKGPIDAVFIGADLLSSRGFVNKVGSLAIARACERGKIPLYCFSSLLKYDPRPFSYAFIEERSSQEIWPDAPNNLNFFAPAFDYIPYSQFTHIVCEAGILTDKTVAYTASSQYPFLRGE